MLIAFTGDPYLAREEAKKEARLKNLPPRLLPGTPETIAALGQPALFESEDGILDFSELDDATWKRIKDPLDRLAGVRDLLIYDPKASSGRTRFYKHRGEVRHFPTPRFKERTIFVQNLLKKHGVKASAAVVHLIAESEADTEGLVREVEKLALLSPPITPERVLPLLAWPPASSAFDLLDPIARREKKRALALTRELLARGEAPLKLLGALTWHYTKLAELGFLLEKQPSARDDEVARALGVAPYSARRLLAAYRRLGSHRVVQALSELLESELAIKTGADPEARLLVLVGRLAGR